MNSRRRWVISLAATAAMACGQADDMGVEETGWIIQELQSRYGSLPGEVRYFDGKADLNGDGSPEVIVYVVGPMVCGTGGCNTLVFTRGETGYEAVTDISLTRPPIRVSPRTSQGWANLLVQVSGGGVFPGYEAELRFDGTGYPANPTVEPAEPASDVEGARVVIPEFDDFTEGKPVPMSGAEELPGGASTEPSPLGQWEWVSFQGMDDSFLAVDDPARYRLEIRENGMSLLADCNRGTGGLRIDGSSLTFTEIATTRMACPPGSLERQYLSYLEYTRGWVMEGGELYLSLMADGGIMRFRPSGQGERDASRDALVPGTGFHATGNIPCRMSDGGPAESCPFGVVREENGNGMVTIIKPDGGTRSILFENGQAMGYDASGADPGGFRSIRGGDATVVHIGQERYEIPDAVIYGG